MAQKKKVLAGDLEIPKPVKKQMSPDLDFSQQVQTDFTTLNALEKANLSGIKSLRDEIETLKIKK